ncbi:RNA polymerase subunit sigma [Pseudomonas sp. NZIPFR-PS5]|nr:RNA polymerase subunit sigma [Pseudomonas sp. NZIPFR-PS5]
MHDLYTQESARLLGVAKRIARTDALAEDIVHDAFIKIWTRAGSFDPARGTARGWIFSVTRHLALNFMRDNAHIIQVSEQSESALLADAALDVTTDVDTFEYRSRSGRVYGCLEQLEPARRNCILHAYVDGYSHSEISQKVGAPLGTVKAWIKRSLVALRECMG